MFNICRNWLVALQNHHGVAALCIAEQLHGRNVHMPLHEGGRDGGDVSRRILVVHDECVVLAGKICFDAVNGADADASAANALGNDIQRAAAGSC